VKKGSTTRAAILTEALAIANRDGLQGLTIGALADRCEMSKSGVFSHFGSRDELQLAVVDEYHRCFEAAVFTPAMKAPRGLPRLQALFERWVAEVTHEVDVGSIYISGAVEFDERQGAVRDALVGSITTFHAAIAKAAAQAIDCQHLRADVDPEQLVFEIHALILALHHDSRFLRKPASQSRAQQGFARLIQHYQPI
jgi:AcrR family transcriptional regulator